MLYFLYTGIMRGKGKRGSSTTREKGKNKSISAPFTKAGSSSDAPTDPIQDGQPPYSNPPILDDHPPINLQGRRSETNESLVVVPSPAETHPTPTPTSDFVEPTNQSAETITS